MGRKKFVFPSLQLACLRVVAKAVEDQDQQLDDEDEKAFHRGKPACFLEPSSFPLFLLGFKWKSAPRGSSSSKDLRFHRNRVSLEHPNYRNSTQTINDFTQYYQCLHTTNPNPTQRVDCVKSLMIWVVLWLSLGIVGVLGKPQRKRLCLFGNEISLLSACLSFPLAKKPTFELGILQNLYIENVWWCQECQQQQFYPPIKLLLLLLVLPLLAFLFSSFLHSLSSLQAGSSLQFTAFAIAQLLAGSTMHCIVMGLHTRENV